MKTTPLLAAVVATAATILTTVQPAAGSKAELPDTSAEVSTDSIAEARGASKAATEKSNLRIRDYCKHHRCEPFYARTKDGGKTVCSLGVKRPWYNEGSVYGRIQVKCRKRPFGLNIHGQLVRWDDNDQTSSRKFACYSPGPVDLDYDCVWKRRDSRLYSIFVRYLPNRQGPQKFYLQTTATCIHKDCKDDSDYEANEYKLKTI
jgi:hypothetical protein